MYSIQAHDGAVAAITCSVSYVISIGTDEKLCVWERFQGHLLHTLPAHKAAYSLQLVMLTHHLLITSNQVHMKLIFECFSITKINLDLNLTINISGIISSLGRKNGRASERSKIGS